MHYYTAPTLAAMKEIFLLFPQTQKKLEEKSLKMASWWPVSQTNDTKSAPSTLIITLDDVKYGTHHHVRPVGFERELMY